MLKLSLMSVSSSSWCCCSELAPLVARSALEQRRHRRVDVGAVAAHLGHRRSRQQAAVWARIDLPDLLVVGVEQHIKAVTKRPVAGKVRLEQEGLEEPADVREVPLGRARDDRGLDDVVLDREGCAERLAAGADRAVVLEQPVAVGEIIRAVCRCGVHAPSVHFASLRRPGSARRVRGLGRFSRRLAAAAAMKAFHPA
jgi:hypothetical protein